MTEIHIIKTVFSILSVAGALMSFLLAYLLYYKYLIQEKRCTKKTTGTVIRYSNIKCGERLYLPVIEYFANGNRYTVVGPEYKGSVVLASVTPFEEGRVTKFYVDEKQVLHIFKYINSFASKQLNPLEELYPLGCEVDVYYDKTNPKLSYVEHYCDNKEWFFILMGTGIFLFQVVIFMLFI